MFLNVCFVPKAESRVYSSPIASNKSAGTFASILKIEKSRSACGKGYRLQFDSRCQKYNSFKLINC